MASSSVIRLFWQNENDPANEVTGAARTPATRIAEELRARTRYNNRCSGSMILKGSSDADYQWQPAAGLLRIEPP
jgi:hypothetical protein